MTVASTAPPRLSVMVRLAAGRGVFRLASQLMAVALAVVWGAESFGVFANAMGLCAWLLFVPTAAEKAALKVLPRTRFLTAHVARLVVRLAAAPVLVLVAAFAVALVSDPQGTVALYLVTAAWSAATGLLMTISGLHRLRGRPMRDAAAFGAMTAVVLAGTAITWLVGWSPTTHLSLLLAGLLAVTGYSLAALPRDWVLVPRPRGVGTVLRGPVVPMSRRCRKAQVHPVRAAFRQPQPSSDHLDPRITDPPHADGALGTTSDRRLLPALGRSTWLLGLSELLDVAALSTVYLVLALSGQTTDSGPLYLAVLVASMVGSLVLYQLKLYQPSTSARLRGTGGASGRARTFRLLYTAERAGLAFAVVMAVLIAFPAGRDLVATESYAVLGAVLAVEVAVSTLVMYANFLLENTNSSVLTITSVSAVVGLATTALIALAVVPWLGAAGGLTALVLAAAVKAGTLRRLLLRRHPELHP